MKRTMIEATIRLHQLRSKEDDGRNGDRPAFAMSVARYASYLLEFNVSLEFIEKYFFFSFRFFFAGEWKWSTRITGGRRWGKHKFKRLWRKIHSINYEPTHFFSRRLYYVYLLYYMNQRVKHLDILIDHAWEQISCNRMLTMLSASISELWVLYLLFFFHTMLLLISSSTQGIDLDFE